MMQRENVRCEYLTHDGLCRAVIENIEGRRTRDESCVNASRSSCCHLCASQESCDISCVYLDTSEGIQAEAELKMDTDQRMLLAADIVLNPGIVDEIKGKYQTIYDQTSANLRFDNLNKAINIMSEKGWRCVNITGFNATGQALSTVLCTYALMERLQEVEETASIST